MPGVEVGPRKGGPGAPNCVNPGNSTTDARDEIHADELKTKMNDAVDANGPTMDSREVGAATTKTCDAGVPTVSECRAVGVASVVGASGTTDVNESGVDGMSATGDIGETVLAKSARTEAMMSTHATGRCSWARPMMVEGAGCDGIEPAGDPRR